MHLLPELASHHAVSIPELLVSRDERQARQHVWLKRHPVPLVSFTVVAPGPIKDSEVTRRIFNHGVTALRALAAKQGWQIQEQAALVSASGPEGMLSIAAPARDLKLATIELEHSHPLGRLWDIDVLTPEYSAAIFLIPVCISFDTAEKRRYATYLILNRRFSFKF